MDVLTSLLIEHEGERLFPYVDTVNKVTIGIGRNLTDRGISHSEAMMMLQNDLAESRSELSHYDWYNQLDDVRKDVLVELHFNIGLTKLLEFHNMITAIHAKSYHLAAQLLLDSLWAKQVHANRANNMANRLENGHY